LNVSATGRVDAAYAHGEALVRAADKDRYLASLFAPAARRRHLIALYAFAAEIARVREAAREPLPGELRLQWWRDALAGKGEAAANPVAAALLDTIAACALPTEPLAALIDAHGFDLYDEPVASLADLEAYARATAGTLFGLGARILDGGDAAAAAPAGIAYGLVQVLNAFARDRAHAGLFLPRDLLQQHGVAAGDIAAGIATPGLRAALAALRARATAAFADFRAAAATVPERAAPAFLAAALVPAWLARLDAAAGDPFVPAELPQWRRQWALWRAARRWPRL
jgi:phytoene synthase